MQTLRTTFLLVALTVAVSQGILTKPVSEVSSESSATSEGFVQGVKTVAHDIKESVLLKKKTVTDAISTVGNTKLNILKNIKDSNVNAVKGIIDNKLAKLDAIKAGKLALLKILFNKVKSPFEKPNQEDGIFGAPTQHPLLELLTGVISKFHGPSKDNVDEEHVQIGDMEYVYVPLPLPVNSQPPVHVRPTRPTDVPEYPSQATSEESSAHSLHSLPPAPTLPPLAYGPPSTSLDALPSYNPRSQF